MGIELEPEGQYLYSMVPDYTRAGIIKHRFFKPPYEGIYGMKIENLTSTLLI